MGSHSDDDLLSKSIQFKLDGLVQSCAFEKSVLQSVKINYEATGTSQIAERRRYYFTAKLISPSLVMSCVIRVPSQCSWRLDDVILERSVDGVTYETLVFSGDEITVKFDEEGSSKNGVSKLRKRLFEVDRAARTLRIGILDLEGTDSVAARIMGVNVVGFPRGANPTPSRLKVLLNTSFVLSYIDEFPLDRAETDTLCGVALINSRRHRQAAEIFLRAAGETELAAATYPKIAEEIYLWGEQVLLLAVCSFLECEQQLPEIIPTLVRTATFAKTRKKKLGLIPDVTYLDAKTALLYCQPALVDIVTSAIEHNESIVIRVAGAKVLEFMVEVLSTEIGEYLEPIVGCVLKSQKYLARVESAQSAVQTLSLVFGNILDSVCGMLPFVDNHILQDLFQSTLVPLVSIDDMDELGIGFDEEESLHSALAHSLRMVSVVVNALQGDVEIPTDLVLFLCYASRAPSRADRIPPQLRDTALICWDSVVKSLALAAKRVEASMFSKYLVLMKDLLEGLFEVTEQDYSQPDSMKSSQSSASSIVSGHRIRFEVASGEGDELRLHVTDTKALNRVLGMVVDCVSALEPCPMVADAYAVIDLYNSILTTIAELSRSIMLDVAHFEAGVSLAMLNSPNPSTESSSDRLNLEPVLATLEELWKAMWLVIRLIPRNIRGEVEQLRKMKEVFEFLVERLKVRSPPKGLLQLLIVIANGANHELNERINNREGLSMKGLLRTLIPWLPCAVHVELFELVGILATASARHLMPKDILGLLHGLATQTSVETQDRADLLLEHLASVLVSTSPIDGEAALSALREYEKERGEGFSSFSLPRSLEDNAHIESFYLHVLLASCFDRFSSLPDKSTGSTICSSDLRSQTSSLEEMIDYASLAVACLTAASKTGRHRKYVAALLGDIFGTCLMMHGHMDSRVRLAGLELFCASMDVLFVVSPTGDESDEPKVVDGVVRLGQVSCRRAEPVDRDMEEKGLGFLCHIASQTLASTQHADHTIQRACLDFLKEMFLGLALGRRSGASVIGLKDLEQIWDALTTLKKHTSSKPLSLLSLWVQCAVVNLLFYATVFGGGRASESKRWGLLAKFAESRVFDQAGKCMQSGVSEERSWGLLMTETYLRLRYMNGVGNRAPSLPPAIWKCIDVLREDWNDEVAVSAGSLRMFSVSETEERLNSKHPTEVHLWHPNLPVDLWNSESVDERVKPKSLDAFISGHRELIEMNEPTEDGELSSLEHSEGALSPGILVSPVMLSPRISPELVERIDVTPAHWPEGKPGYADDQYEAKDTGEAKLSSFPSADDMHSLTDDYSLVEEDNETTSASAQSRELETRAENVTSTLQNLQFGRSPPIEAHSDSSSFPSESLIEPELATSPSADRLKPADSDSKKGALKKKRSLTLSIATRPEEELIKMSQNLLNSKFADRRAGDPGTPRGGSELEDTDVSNETEN
ncbi:hypothetical protein NDN08_007507 [Rhodosorus marinus]|uniref:Virilizer N-terminal domain-containing protein n=1 Tax=Rhodosorus marinus TaxID=101924 RepID=A0AAV8UXS2_9RHOD|nr:hypothetical protein NDN08_007507 [Rhodosorus marinus]